MLPWIGGSFNTVIGVVFLLIVLLSPGGLMGIWDRAWDHASTQRSEPPGAQPEAAQMRRNRRDEEVEPSRGH